MIKEQLYKCCIEILNNRIEKYKTELELYKEARENADKESGDDDSSNGGSDNLLYDKTIQYLEEANTLKNQLKQVDIFQDTVTVKVGNIVKTSKGNFFISVPLGKVECNKLIYFAISKEAPVGQLLLGKKVGDSISFNGNKFTLQEII